MISIHAHRVEGDLPMRLCKSKINISIHALRVEGDSGHRRIKVCGGGISIHALRVEGDGKRGVILFLRVGYFYPRPPGGGRLQHLQ